MVFVLILCAGAAGRVGLIGTGVAVARAAPRADLAARAKAKALYESATSHYNLGEFREALTDYKEAYRVTPDPVFLFNVAQCHRQMNEPADAARAYRSYLRELPAAKNRVAVEKLIADMDQSVRERHATEPPLGPEPPQPTPAVTPATEPGAPAVETPPVEAHQEPVAAPLAASGPDRVGIGLLIGGGAVLAVGLGFVINSLGQDSAARDVTTNTDLAARESQLSSANTSGGIGYGLIGLGAAVAVAGVVKLVLAGRSAGKKDVAWNVDTRAGRLMGVLSGSF